MNNTKLCWNCFKTCLVFWSHTAQKERLEAASLPQYLPFKFVRSVPFKKSFRLVQLRRKMSGEQRKTYRSVKSPKMLIRAGRLGRHLLGTNAVVKSLLLSFMLCCSSTSQSSTQFHISWRLIGKIEHNYLISTFVFDNLAEMAFSSELACPWPLQKFPATRPQRNNFCLCARYIATDYRHALWKCSLFVIQGFVWITKF
jgi:hypothetical protein